MNKNTLKERWIRLSLLVLFVKKECVVTFKDQDKDLNRIVQNNLQGGPPTIVISRGPWLHS